MKARAVAKTSNTPNLASGMAGRPIAVVASLSVAVALAIGSAGPAVASETDGSRGVGASELAAYLDLGQQDGRQLVRGFFFLSGPVVKVIPEL